MQCLFDKVYIMRTRELQCRKLITNSINAEEKQNTKNITYGLKTVHILSPQWEYTSEYKH
jgi:hypothetical protein